MRGGAAILRFPRAFSVSRCSLGAVGTNYAIIANQQHSNGQQKGRNYGNSSLSQGWTMYRIICADDDPITRKLYEHIFPRNAYQVHIYTDGNEALEAFLEHPADLVILDNEMASMSGFETCRLLRELTVGEHIPILIVSASESREELKRAQKARATAFINKPLNALQLLEKVEYLLKRYEAVKRMRRMGVPEDEIRKIESLEYSDPSIQSYELDD